MKAIAYRLLRLWIMAGLYCYYGKIKISGIGNVPRTGPVLFLPNHQGALMDVLLLVTHCRRKPFFLTRSDVFNNPRLVGFFSFLGMLPIYRIRDGRESLKKNQAVFDRCGRLFGEGEALVMFPEGNHNFRRRVRPLSKGFTRIVFNALKTYPDLDIQIVPVGMNYVKNTGFPDRVSLYFGPPISANSSGYPADSRIATTRLKKQVSDSLKTLTTHISDELPYEETIERLKAENVDFLNPVEVAHPKNAKAKGKNPLRSMFGAISKAVFMLLNLPVIAIWRAFIKPKVWEPEFTGTLRFGFALLVYPLYYLVAFTIGMTSGYPSSAFLALGVLFVLNLGFVKFYPVR